MHRKRGAEVVPFVWVAGEMGSFGKNRMAPFGEAAAVMVERSMLIE